MLSWPWKGPINFNSFFSKTINYWRLEEPILHMSDGAEKGNLEIGTLHIA